MPVFQQDHLQYRFQDCLQILFIIIKAFASNSGGTGYSSQGTFTTLCEVTGDPAVFGNGIWNVYGYNGRNLDLSGITYVGYYTEPNLTFNTTARWGDLLSPSSALGYLGCPVNIDDFTVQL